jgi:hypothetical protein
MTDEGARTSVAAESQRQIIALATAALRLHARTLDDGALEQTTGSTVTVETYR